MGDQLYQSYEVSRAYVKPGQEWKSNSRPHRPAVAWNIDEKAREVRIKEEKPKAEEKSNAGNFRCFRCNEAGHVVANCSKRLPKEGKIKAKAKVDGNSEEEEREK
jgi:hypothetical protein